MIIPVLADSEFIDFTNIPDLNASVGINKNVIDLDKYYNGTDLFYKFKAGSKGLEGVDININDGEVDITSNIAGEFSIIFIADNDTDDKESNDVDLSIFGVSAGTITRSSDFSPAGSSVVMEVGEKKSFAASGENVSAEWYLDGLKLPETSGTFVFDAVIVGTNELQVTVNGVSNTWTILVEEKEVIEEVEVPVIVTSECGNGKRESGENCQSCPSDVQCSTGSICRNAICIKDESASNIILWVGLLGALILVFVGGVVFAKKKGYLDSFSLDFVKNIFTKKKKEEVLPEEVEEDLTGLKNYISENLKKGYKKEELVKAALGQGWKQEQIDKILNVKEELKPLENYLLENLKKGYKKEDLAKAALEQGWKQEEVNEVLSKI
ncbi:MAG: hypothetical protein CMH62_02940 [Nanoarchaeota archaeon]|nr:hypothetical protein [Nanoarchaeota archaeon]|tara:strand:- start:1517 stop:2659 length:1143 start_codon:yes stop_codon:yes gene_type:complete